MTEMTDFKHMLKVGLVLDGKDHIKYIYLGRYRDSLADSDGYLYGVIGDVPDDRALDVIDVQTQLSMVAFRSREANSVFTKQPKKFYRIVGSVDIDCLRHTLSHIWGLERIGEGPG